MLNIDAERFYSLFEQLDRMEQKLDFMIASSIGEDAFKKWKNGVVIFTTKEKENV